MAIKALVISLLKVAETAFLMLKTNGLQWRVRKIGVNN